MKEDNSIGDFIVIDDGIYIDVNGTHYEMVMSKEAFVEAFQKYITDAKQEAEGEHK